MAVGVVKRIRPGAGDDLQTMMRLIVTHQFSRQVLSSTYGWLSWSQKRAFHERFNRTFWSGPPAVVSGDWAVVFQGRRIRVPLTSSALPLDWDLGVALLGHDVDVKETYAALLASSERPDVFVDVGTNFGTHSLLFLVHGVDTRSFEPNPACVDYFRTLCAVNDVSPTIEPVAVSDEPGWADLHFPATEPWLGSTDDETAAKLSESHQLETCRVPLTTLDAYRHKLPPGRVVIKVDTEGNEARVLRGAGALINDRHPLIIFESWQDASRLELAALFDGFEYEVATLPWSPDRRGPALTSAEFLASPAVNFIASARTAAQ